MTILQGALQGRAELSLRLQEVTRSEGSLAERKRFAAAGSAGHQQSARRRSVSWLPFAVLPTIFLIGRAAPKHLAFKGYGAAIGVYTIISAGMYLSGDDDE